MDPKESLVLTPQVTLAILTRNHEDFIAEALESAVMQSVPFAQVSVLDNGSTDATKTRILQWLADHRQYKNVRLMESLRNMNASGGTRVLIDAAETDYVAILHGDDKLRPEFHESVKTALTELQVPTALNVDLQAFTTGDVAAPSNSRTVIRSYWTGNARIDRLLVRAVNLGTMPGSVLPVSLAQSLRIMSLTEDVCCVEDWIAWMRLLASGVPIKRIDKVLVDYRRHSSDSGSDERRFSAKVQARALAFEEASTPLQRAIAARSLISAVRSREFGRSSLPQRYSSLAHEVTSIPLHLRLAGSVIRLAAIFRVHALAHFASARNR